MGIDHIFVKVRDVAVCFPQQCQNVISLKEKKMVLRMHFFLWEWASIEKGGKVEATE